jgi:hypothetical protein
MMKKPPGLTLRFRPKRAFGDFKRWVEKGIVVRGLKTGGEDEVLVTDGSC